MDYTTLCAESKEDQEQVTKRMPSLYEVCHQLVDGRCARGKRTVDANLGSTASREQHHQVLRS